MKKGIVLEVHDEHVTILTPEGEFLKSRKLKGNVDIGEEIAFFPLYQTEKRKSKAGSAIFRLRWAIVSILTVFILASTMIPSYVSNQVYAYISVDVNPSIELGINKKMEVVSLDAFNDDGRRIVGQIKSWKKQDVTKVSSQLFDIIRQNGYLKENSEVLIASTLTHVEDDGWNIKMQDKITSISENIKDDEISITTMESTINKRTDAINMGLSPGRFIQKEQEKEIVEKEDTSKSDVNPTAPVNRMKAINASISNSNNQSSTSTKQHHQNHNNQSKKLAKSIKEERKEHQKQLKEERKEEHAQKKEERKEIKEQEKNERKVEREQAKKERKEQQHNNKHINNDKNNNNNNNGNNNGNNNQSNNNGKNNNNNNNNGNNNNSNNGNNNNNGNSGNKENQNGKNSGNNRGNSNQ
ncbi:anti-sigma factor domain-containing protein [Sutcliffiella rhizosphaerae]|uniref:RsgI N-terminal anti-sigma domain-containing protein n=1 Tax=Sutcliffiella rhizosphaerae TaxID=2880967 RepID=A0ABN8ABZ2_9BACI|nr:anti-sigma factor domain-containing protein [Sutcliffiella rhizosphaerae]CAG9620528.1 hypothetical protein BACCIP111883_01297 [Sutcliffiella rhizosphaerae]